MNAVKEEVFTTNTHVCPWWLAYTFDHKLRRLSGFNPVEEPSIRFSRATLFEKS